MISLLWAMDENRLIGKDNDLPWRLPEDLKYFKKVTMGHPIVMGRKTYESIGRPLPGRQNIIITRNPNYKVDGCDVFHSIDEFLSYYKSQSGEIFVIGGAEIFKATIPFADRLYVTKIHETFTGNAYFPELDMGKWSLISSEQGIRDEKNPYDYEFLVYERN